MGTAVAKQRRAAAKACGKWSKHVDQWGDWANDAAVFGIGDHNYCRNPDGDETIWCFTTDPDMIFDYCNPVAGGGSRPQTIKGVRLVRSTTGIGIGSAGWKWDVHRLRLFSDKSCSQSLDIDAGEPIGSGWYDNKAGNHFSPHAALGWQGRGGFFGGRRSDSEQIWVGERWETPQTIQCVTFEMRIEGASQVTVELLRGDLQRWVPLPRVFPTGKGENKLVW